MQDVDVSKKAPVGVRHVMALDGLRGYAAMLVAFYHAILHIDPRVIDGVLSPALDDVNLGNLLLKLVLVFFNGSTAVLIFYALSGAVLSQSLLRSGVTISSIGLFIIRRIFRLFPVLFVCMGAIWLLSWLMQRLGLIFPAPHLHDVILNAFLLSTNVHGPSTSIQIEALATPFIIFFALVYRSSGIYVALVLFGLSVVAIQKPEIVFSLKNMHASVFVFFAGMLAALPEVKPVFARVNGRDIGCMLLAVFILRHLVHLESLPGLIAQVILIAGLISALMWGAPLSRIHAFLELPLSQFLGKISYSFYLFNVPVLWLLWYTFPLSVAGMGLGLVAEGLLIGLASVLITVPLAYLSYCVVERRFIKYGAAVNDWISKARRC